MRIRAFLYLVLAFLAFTASAEKLRQEPDFSFNPAGPSVEVRQVQLDPTIPVTLSLAPAAESAADQLRAMEAWNRAGNVPVRIGITRPLPGVIRFDLGTEPSTSDRSFLRPHTSTRAGTVLTARIDVGNAAFLRARLDDVHLSPSSRIWVSGTDGRQIEVDHSVDEEGGIWTPMVKGPQLLVQLESGGAGDGSFEIRKVAEAFLSGLEPEALGEECIEDASCFNSSALDVIDPYRRAVAALVFVVGDSLGFCTGALINDTDSSSTTPYLLTANHCFSNQQVAASLEAFWDYRTSSCNGNVPELGSLPRSTGSTLLVTSKSTDVTLVALNSVPSQRAALGWDASAGAVKNGTILYRISHPFAEAFSIPYPQMFTRMIADQTFPGCTNLEPPNFIYSRLLDGATLTGSSGGPVILAGGYVVGQLYGGCGPDESVCSQNNREVDGALSVSFPLLAQYLDPTSTPNDTCTPSQTTACLLNGRFRATLRYRAAFDDQPVNTNALVKPVSGFADPNFETAFFYFNSPSNIEVMLKMLDQGNTNGQGQPTIAVLFGTATPLRAEITITDTKTGATKLYTSGYNQMRGTTDFTAFVK